MEIELDSLLARGVSISPLFNSETLELSKNNPAKFRELPSKCSAAHPKHTVGRRRDGFRGQYLNARNLLFLVFLLV